MERLDSYLQGAIEKEWGISISRRYVDKILENGGIKLNNEIIKKKGFKFNPETAKPEFVRPVVEKVLAEYRTGRINDQEVEGWQDSAITEDQIDPEKLARAGDIRKNIIFENEDFLIAYKPPGVLSHPGRGDQTRDTMVYQFIRYMSEVHKYVPRAGLIHRLDADTQGLILFAKNMESYNMLKREFEERNVQKYYFAVCVPTGGVNNLVKRNAALFRGQDMPKQINDRLDGNTEVLSFIDELQSFELDGFIGKVRGTKLMRFEMDKNELRKNNVVMIKNCMSTFTVIPGEEDQYKIIIRPHTGRTHQIRAQVKYLGLSIESDRIYSRSNTSRGILMLLAFGISFSFKGKKYSFVLPREYWKGYLA